MKSNRASTWATPHVLGRHRHVALDPYVKIASFGASMPPRCERTPVGARAPPRMAPALLTPPPRGMAGRHGYLCPKIPPKRDVFQDWPAHNPERLQGVVQLANLK